MTEENPRRFSPGIFNAMAAAVLFGASTPLAKHLLVSVEPALMAGLLYLGSGLGLASFRLLWRPSRERALEAQLTKRDLPWLAAAILCGGVLGPALLMIGLMNTPASSASLLLNLEGVFTALLAWFVFRENFDRRIGWGMVCITAGAVALSWLGHPALGIPWNSLAIVAACLAWAADNNLTRKISASDPVQIAMLKGLCAGGVNTTLGLLMGGKIPGIPMLVASGVVGFVGYGLSLTFFVLALRHLGVARTGAYFSLAPFVGAGVSVVFFDDQPTVGLLVAAVLMAAGVWLHLTERHEHQHRHQPLEHDHLHTHDAHHQHVHKPGDLPGEPHSHSHRHEEITHSHPHYPDLHHRHGH